MEKIVCALVIVVLAVSMIAILLFNNSSTPKPMPQLINRPIYIDNKEIAPNDFVLFNRTTWTYGRKPINQTLYNCKIELWYIWKNASGFETDEIQTENLGTITFPSNGSLEIHTNFTEKVHYGEYGVQFGGHWASNHYIDMALVGVYGYGYYPQP